MNLAVFGYSRGKLIRVASDQRLKRYCVRRQVRGGQSVVDYWWLTLRIAMHAVKHNTQCGIKPDCFTPTIHVRTYVY